jgi:hypothetical protein
VNRELMKEFLRKSFPNPERKGCPDEDALQALAEDRIVPDDPTALHVGSCSECYEEYLHLRRELEESRSSSPTDGQQSLNSPSGTNVLSFPDRHKNKTS